MADFNYKVSYMYLTTFKKIKASPKIRKGTVTLEFNSEPSEYDIESKVKDWVSDLQRDVMNDIDCEIEFQEIVKIRKLKVVKGYY
jgi:hypothetical protein